MGIPWLDMGTISGRRVLAVKTRMGTLDYGAAAYCAMLFSLETQASLLIAVGMAFGVSPYDEDNKTWGEQQEQRIGDVLVAAQVVLYDRREKIEEPPGQIKTTLAEGSRRSAHLESLAVMGRLSVHQNQHGSYKVHLGQVLTGSAKIQSSSYRRALVARVSSQLRASRWPVVGGDMEGGGLLTASQPSDPKWAMVKGIADFADQRRAILEPTRVRDNQRMACLHALDFLFKYIHEDVK